MIQRMNPKETYIHRAFNEIGTVIQELAGTKVKGCIIGPGCETPLEYDDYSWIRNSYQPFVFAAFCEYYDVDYKLSLIDSDEKVIESILDQENLIVPKEGSRLTEEAFSCYLGLTGHSYHEIDDLLYARLPDSFRKNVDTFFSDYYDVVVCTHVPSRINLNGTCVITDQKLDALDYVAYQFITPLESIVIYLNSSG
ncbi:MAG: hypothetical protein ACLFP2_04035 [Candidatus Woesearchaeota archaeon]